MASEKERAAGSPIQPSSVNPLPPRGKRKAPAKGRADVTTEVASKLPRLELEADSSASIPAAYSSSLGCIGLNEDCLSIALSFLDTRDFLRAVRTSKRWYDARLKRSAWPLQLNVTAIIRSMQEANNESRRQLLMKSPDKLKQMQSQVVARNMWRHVLEVEIVTRGKLPLLAPLATDFPSMAALTIDKSKASAEDTQALYAAVAPRLQSLRLFGCGYELHRNLAQLTSLRVLVLTWRLIAPVALAQLKQLQYLHMDIDFELATPTLMCVVRWLSTVHQLRSLSLSLATRSHAEELCETDPSKSGVSSVEIATLALDPPINLAISCGLTNLSFVCTSLSTVLMATTAASLCQLEGLPQLTRLRWPKFVGGQVTLLGENRSIWPTPV